MTDQTILQMKNIVKTFPGVKALDNVTFSCRPGEVHALLGENGAGKSTLMKILSAAYRPDSGEIIFKNELFKHSNPIAAQKAGIGIIYQEFNLVPHMSVVENIFLGREPLIGCKLIDYRTMRDEAQKLLSGLGLTIDVNQKVKNLSVAQQQMVEIAKALSMNAELIVMDEPTATLTDREIEFLFGTIRTLRSQGKTIIYISHRLEEIFEVCDRVTILKDGKTVGTENVPDLDKDRMIKMMVGRTLGEYYPDRSTARKGDKVLEVRNITRKGVLNDISFSAYAGEILGISGLVGAGRTELARAIFGADSIDGGAVLIDENEVKINEPLKAIRLNIGFATEDRKGQGLILGLSVRKNISLAILPQLIKYGLIQPKKEKEVADRYMKILKIAAPGIDYPVKGLSGGNQQKVVLAKWLAKDCRIIILDEPTRGIDVGAKAEIYNLMRKLADQGKVIIMISSELPEVIGVSDRVLVMHSGKITGAFNADEVTEEKIMKCATGEVA
ncbi:MAG: sugar ABC transporter ATP-binding protein [Spirochaetales bacterium]|nr:sugar ABC transporter ATP-binding protein [Spirochaetales bacterium]